MSAASLPTAVPATVVEGPLAKGGRWNWYVEPGGDTHQPMTNLLKHIETDRYGLDQWMQRQVLVGAARRPDLIIGAQAIGMPPPEGYTDEQKSTLNKLTREASNAAKVSDGATLGTAMHTATERIDRGEPLSAISFPEPYASSLRAYDQLVRGHGWEVVEVERTVLNLHLDAAGTLDRIYRIPELGVVIGDVKTEAEPLRNLLKITAQLAGYANGASMWSRAAQAWVPMPEGLRTDVAVLVHVRDGQAVPYVIDLSRGWRAALRAAAQRDDVKSAKVALGEDGAWAFPFPYAATGAATTAEALVERRAVSDPQVQAHARAVLGMDEPPVSHLAAGDPELLAAIGGCDDRAGLATVWEMANRLGVPWDGELGRAGARRARIIECPQRALHTGTGYCACGWRSGDRP